jgi:hypothetical protein
LGAAQATSLSVGASAGVFRELLAAAAARSLQLSVRADAALLYESLTHFSSDDPQPVRRGRWLPALAAAVELHWDISAGAGLHLAAGGELAAGPTDVFVRGEKVTSLAAGRGLLELGVHARF